MVPAVQACLILQRRVPKHAMADAQEAVREREEEEEEEEEEEGKYLKLELFKGNTSKEI